MMDQKIKEWLEHVIEIEKTCTKNPRQYIIDYCESLLLEK